MRPPAFPCAPTDASAAPQTLELELNGLRRAPPRGRRPGGSSRIDRSESAGRTRKLRGRRRGKEGRQMTMKAESNANLQPAKRACSSFCLADAAAAAASARVAPPSGANKTCSRLNLVRSASFVQPHERRRRRRVAARAPRASELARLNGRRPGQGMGGGGEPASGPASRLARRPLSLVLVSCRQRVCSGWRHSSMSIAGPRRPAATAAAAK